jgi:hypothetical protein
MPLNSSGFAAVRKREPSALPASSSASASTTSSRGNGALSRLAKSSVSTPMMPPPLLSMLPRPYR